MEFDPYRLHSKGFRPEEIEKIGKTISLAEQKKQAHVKILETMAYWVMISTAIIGNFLISFTLIPYIVLLDNINLYIVVVILGVAIGLLFTSVIKSLEIKLHHHTLIIFLVPVTAFISFFIITGMSNQIASFYNIKTAHNPVIVGLIYIISFMVPYFNFLFSKYIKTHKHHRLAEKG